MGPAQRHQLSPRRPLAALPRGQLGYSQGPVGREGLTVPPWLFLGERRFASPFFIGEGGGQRQVLLVGSAGLRAAPAGQGCLSHGFLPCPTLRRGCDAAGGVPAPSVWSHHCHRHSEVRGTCPPARETWKDGCVAGSIACYVRFLALVGATFSLLGC